MKKLFSFCALVAGFSCGITHAFPSEEERQSAPLHLQTMSYFRKHNALPDDLNINQQDTDGNTLLHTAVFCGDYNLLRHLLKLNNINPNIRNNNGSTPLIIAASRDLTAFDFLMRDDKVEHEVRASHNAFRYFNTLRERVPTPPPPQSAPVSLNDFYR